MFNLEAAPWASPSWWGRSAALCALRCRWWAQSQGLRPTPRPPGGCDLWLLAKSENSQVGLFCEWSSMGPSHIHGLPAVPGCLLATGVRLCLVMPVWLRKLLLLDSHSWLSEDWRAGAHTWTIPFSPHKELTAALLCLFQTKTLFPKAQSFPDVGQSRVPFLGLGLQMMQGWPFKHTQVLLNKMCFFVLFAASVNN